MSVHVPMSAGDGATSVLGLRGRGTSVLQQVFSGLPQRRTVVESKTMQLMWLVCFLTVLSSTCGGRGGEHTRARQ